MSDRDLYTESLQVIQRLAQNNNHRIGLISAAIDSQKLLRLRAKNIQGTISQLREVNRSGTRNLWR